MAEKRKIEKLNPQYLHDRIQIRLQAELDRQKAAGKEFITGLEVDALIDQIMQEEFAPKK